MSDILSLEQRFAMQRAKYEVKRMSRPALEAAALRLLRSRMEQKNQVRIALASQGIIFKMDEPSEMPELVSEETFLDMLELSMDGADDLSPDIYDIGWEDEDLGDDGLSFAE